MNWATRQTRVDLAIDPGKSVGYATLDLFASHALGENLRLVGGIDNVFDKTYAKHLSRKSVFDTTVARVNEPGRTVYLTMQMTF